MSRSNNFHRGMKPPPRGSLPAYIMVPAIGLTGTIIYGYYAFLEEAPFTKRKRLIATTPEFERQIGDSQYKSLLQQFRGQILPSDHRASITVRRVGSRVSDAARLFSRQNLPSDEWRNASPPTFTVVRSDMANAFVLPNNHVFVLTGLFKFVRDEDELAAVLGHEMAHNLARHSGEKMSGGILMSILANVVLLIDPTGMIYSLFVPAATLLHELPHSRKAEVEADYIGLHLAAEACYDPSAAKRVFSAMAKGDPTGDNHQTPPPEFLSTHPSNDSRISNFDKWLPEAQARFDSDAGMRCRQIRDEMRSARRRAAEEAYMKETQRRGDYFGRSEPRPRWA